MSLANASPFAALPVPYIAPDGREVVITLVKATFVQKGGRLLPAAAQSPVRIGDVPWDPKAESSSVRYPSDVATIKKGTDVNFMSTLDADSNRARQLDSGIEPESVVDGGYKSYLLNVDKPLVLPVGVKIRFVITADDVIHAWWVPSLGWKQDAIPGIINDQWTRIDTPGIYRGQCAELCGKDHGFMPIVVKAVPKAQFEQWLATQEAAVAAARGAATAQAAAPPAPEG